MAHVIDRMLQVPALQSASRAVALVSVAWSPGPRRSREMLTGLESTQEVWSPDARVEFFDLWPERDDDLNRWYEDLCAFAFPRFELHGHGYGPLWWLSDGKVIECFTKPYEYSLQDLQKRSTQIFESR